MNRIKLRFVIGALLGMLFLQSTAQDLRVYGYYPSYRATSVLTGQYEKYTDLAFSFINAQTNGALITTTPDDAMFGFDMNKFIVVRDNCATDDVNLWISLAGADKDEIRSKRMNDISGNTAARERLVSELVAFANLHGCYGISVDWEFPKTAAARNNHVALLEDFASEIASSGNTNLQIAIAVGGEYEGNINHIQYVHDDLFNSKSDLIDEWHMMTYDYPKVYDINHSTLYDSKKTLETYQSKGVPYSKMFMGVPFYGRDANRTAEIEYNNLGCSSQAFNTDSYAKGGVTYYYNGKQTIEDKIDAVASYGGQGIIIWDVGQDCSAGSSLLDVVANHLGNVCNIPTPNLGTGVGICDGAAVTLDPNVPTSTGRTFTWSNEAGELVSSSATANTHEVNVAGTYTVEINDFESCTRTATVKVATGGAIAVTGGSGCANENVTLEVTNPESGKVYNWYEQEVGGGKLGTGTSYEGSFTESTSIYVEQQTEGVQSYTDADFRDLDGLGSSVWGWSDNATTITADLLTAETDLTVKGARVYVRAKTGATFTVEVLGSTVTSKENVSIEKSEEYTIPANSSAGELEYVIVDLELDFVLAAGEYFIATNITSGQLVRAFEIGRTNTGTAGIYDLGVHCHNNFGNGFVVDEKDGASYNAIGFLWRYEIQTGVSASCPRSAGAVIVEKNGVDAPAIIGATTVPKGTTGIYTPETAVADVTYEYTYSGDDVTLNINQADGSVEAMFGENATGGILSLNLVNGEPCGVGNPSVLTIKIGTPNGGTGSCATVFGFIDDYGTEESPNGVYYWGDQDVFASSRVNDQLEVTITHADADGKWSPMGMELNLGDDDGAVYIDATANKTGSVSVTNTGDATINVAFTFLSSGGTTETAGASFEEGDSGTTPYGADITAGATKVITFDLANPVVSYWSDDKGACEAGGGTLLGTTCVVPSTLKVEAISGIEWSVNELLSESPWNGPLTNTKVIFDNFKVGEECVEVDEAPIVEVISPNDNSEYTESELITVSFTVDDELELTEDNVTVTYNGTSQNVSLDGGTFTASFDAVLGAESITIVANDGASSSEPITVPIQVNLEGNDKPVVEVISPSDNSDYAEGDLITVSFTVDNEFELTEDNVTVTYNGSSQSVSLDGGIFTASFDAVLGAESITIVADDGVTSPLPVDVAITVSGEGDPSSPSGCVSVTGFKDDYTTEDSPAGVYYWGDQDVFATSRVNEQLEVTVTHADADGKWSPMGMELNLGDEDGAVYINASTNQTGSVSVTNTGDATINVAFTFLSSGGTTETAGASFEEGDSGTTPYGADIKAGATKVITFDLANPVVSYWSDDKGACEAGGGTLLGTTCVVPSTLKVEAISGIEWSVNELLSESPWNGPLDGVKVVFDDFKVGNCTPIENEKPTIFNVTVEPNPANIGDEVSIIVDAEGSIVSTVITVDGEPINGTTWVATTEGDHTVSVVVTDNDDVSSDPFEKTITVKGVIDPSSPSGCASVTGFKDDYTTGDSPAGVYYWGDQDVFATSRVNEQLEVTVTHADADGKWSPMGMELNLGDEDGAVYIDATSNQTGSVSVTNTGDATINIAFTFLSSGGSSEKAGASFEEGDSKTTPYGTDIAAGETEVITFDLANPVVSYWSDDKDACEAGGGILLGTTCVVPSSFKVEAISGIEWSVNELLSESPWNGPLDGVKVVFDDFKVGDCAPTENQKPTISQVTVTPNPANVGDDVTITVDAQDADGEIISYEIKVDDQTFDDASATWKPTEAGTYEVFVTVMDDENAIATETVSVEVNVEGNANPVISSITITPSPATVGEEVSISVKASDSDGSVESYRIVVDGEVYNTSTATWMPSSAGTFEVVVTVTDDKGGKATDKKSVVVRTVDGIDVITVNTPSSGATIDNPGVIDFDIDVTSDVAKVNYVIINADGSITQYTIDEGDDFDLVWRPKGASGTDGVGNIGENKIIIKAYDSNGDLLESKEVVLTLTGTPNFETGINDAVYISEIKIYPMPAMSHATVSVGARAAGTVTVEVLDMNGNVLLVESGYVSSKVLYEAMFSVEDLNSGIYFARVTLNGESVTSKLVVQ
jgi:GH18 family chitinase